ncbi:CFI-box-CTERM domain-containing protein [Vibrio sp. WZ-1]|uniref:CFI-box-CTERM domain-containing protein n=1 Tax=Vibrio sp. WZ-1 TaxID=3454501 RepID=UPI003F864435
MLLVENNPFRFIGVLSNAKDKEIHRQKAKLSKYASIGKSINTDYDYDFLSIIERTDSSIIKAFSQIDKRYDKLEHALFWFINLNQFDEISLSHLNESSFGKAIATWDKVTRNRSITKSNISCLNNISTLQLTSLLSNELKLGIANKFKVVQSDAFHVIVAEITDETFLVDSKDLCIRLTESIVRTFIASNKTDLEIIDLFSLCEQWIVDHVVSVFCEPIIFGIERNIEKTRANVVKNPESGYRLAVDLYNENLIDLERIESFLGRKNIKFKAISEALSKELMKLDIAYFNALHETKEVYDESLEILSLAQSLATKDITIREIEESINDMLARKENNRVNKYYDDIYDDLLNFKDRLVSIDSVISLINLCKPKLDFLTVELGRTEEYIKVSSLIVNVCLNTIIDCVNEAQDGKQTKEFLSSLFNVAYSTMLKLSFFDMDYDIKRRFDKNFEIIQSLKATADEWTRKKEGCYIATMAYGDYEHPQVVYLRKFRDETLSKTKLGRNFIKRYYKYSPLLVEKLKGHNFINRVIRICLDIIVKVINK